MNVNDLVHQIVEQGCEKTILALNPVIERMPLPIRRYDDPFLPFGKAVISATRDLVCGYVFHFADYLALGAAGAVALERTIAYAGTNTITILHGPFGDSSFTRLLAATAFNAHLITLSTHSAEELSLINVQQDMCGKFLPRARTLQIENTHLNITDDEVLYSDFGEDFANRVREKLKAFNDKHHS